MANVDDDWLKAVAEASSVGERLVQGAEDLNRAADHIVELLRESVVLYRLRSPRAAFLAITAIEETAKIHIGMFRGGEPAKRSKDPLFSHKDKHRLASAPTIAMGSRLNAAVGETRVHELLDAARKGHLIAKRESSLYLESRDGKVYVPTESVTKIDARELILLAIEAFDDALVGYTNHSFELAEVTDELFVEVAAT